MAGGVDGFDARQAKVPEQVRLQERRDKAAAGAIDMNGDVEAGLFLKLVESGAERKHVLIVSGKGAAQHGDNANGVLVTGRGDALRVGDNLVCFEGNLPGLDVPIAGEFVPADLGIGARDQVRLVCRLAHLAHLLTPAPLECKAA